jgi:hypothetical protein
VRCSAASAISLRRSSTDIVNSTELPESLSPSSPAPLGFTPLEGFSPGCAEDAGGADVEGGQTNEVGGVAVTVGGDWMAAVGGLDTEGGDIGI